ncbi:hypothetical protein [Roseisolibacter sp. H3M3-2]|uniref:hypothetical protein n=1 Tax=Roseisolibacter sp. H3M3-2 TaxID=3031323 RepID=UPI0023DB6485|nr:hypothetical protein [Roseisolibacter sp. H3M3-2]MDF1502914.1 hypothetical protein [Roseisolibacter sp. H3M3-2]
MRSRATARRTPPPDQKDEIPPPPRARPAARATAPASRRARRPEVPREPSPVEDVVRVLPTDPGALYREEKSRRVPRVDPAVMDEARRLLAEAMTPIGGRKKGGTVTVGQAARRRKPALKPDEFDLPEYRPGFASGGGGGGGERDDADD